jgi:hypothetical protein
LPNSAQNFVLTVRAMSLGDRAVTLNNSPYNIFHRLIRRVVIGLDPSSVLMWAALMPHAIGCHDLIASPVANRSEGAAQ